ncbi:MAG: hypothetical protein Q4C49_00390 [Bacillota bacterium]|nr:hypothetical protein [Bacillota bacterium]
MAEENLVVIKSTFNKTPNQKYYIAPCKGPNGLYPDCIRKVDAHGDLILSEDDKKQMSKGKQFLAEDEPIVVEHGTVFNLDNPIQAAQWEAIKYSKLIAKERDELDINGNYVIDGGKSIVDQYQNARGRYGTAELYIERPGRTAKAKNDFRKLILQAQNLVVNDDLSHRVTICKLFEKNMEHAHPNDVEDFLLTQAEKYPEKVIRFYNTEEAAVRLLLIVARERGIVASRQDGLYYSDIKLGASLDFAVDYLRAAENKMLCEAIKKDTYPELQKKTDKNK